MVCYVTTMRKCFIPNQIYTSISLEYTLVGLLCCHFRVSMARLRLDYSEPRINTYQMVNYLKKRIGDTQEMDTFFLAQVLIIFDIFFMNSIW